MHARVHCRVVPPSLQRQFQYDPTRASHHTAQCQKEMTFWPARKFAARDIWGARGWGTGKGKWDAASGENPRGPGGRSGRGTRGGAGRGGMGPGGQGGAGRGRAGRQEILGNQWTGRGERASGMRRAARIRADPVVRRRSESAADLGQAPEEELPGNHLAEFRSLSFPILNYEVPLTQQLQPP